MRALSKVMPGKDINPAFAGFRSICSSLAWGAIVADSGFGGISTRYSLKL